LLYLVLFFLFQAEDGIRDFSRDWSSDVCSSDLVGVNPDYAIAQGDRIAVRMWGARTFDGVLVVDIQGNIFLPEIGPIKVEGITNDRLAQRVRASVAQVYTDNVKVYTNLLGTQPLGVFVTGAVPYPGRYPGAKDDSVLYYLARAGGIDPQSGSYRDI